MPNEKQIALLELSIEELTNLIEVIAKRAIRTNLPFSDRQEFIFLIQDAVSGSLRSNFLINGQDEIIATLKKIESRMNEEKKVIIPVDAAKKEPAKVPAILQHLRPEMDKAREYISSLKLHPNGKVCWPHSFYDLYIFLRNTLPESVISGMTANGYKAYSKVISMYASRFFLSNFGRITEENFLSSMKKNWRSTVGFSFIAKELNFEIQP